MLVDGEHIDGSPFALDVAPGETRGAQSTAEGAGLFHATAGELASIIVTAYDAEGNRERGLDPAGNRFNLSVSVPCVTSTWKPACADPDDEFRMVAWRALGEGRYQLTYNATTAGVARRK